MKREKTISTSRPCASIYRFGPDLHPIVRWGDTFQTWASIIKRRRLGIWVQDASPWHGMFWGNINVEEGFLLRLVVEFNSFSLLDSNLQENLTWFSFGVRCPS